LPDIREVADMADSPTGRTLALLREEGWAAGVVERRLPRCPVSVDWLGLADVIAVRAGAVLAVQATSGDHHAARRAKALAEPRLRVLLASGMRFEIWSWSKRGAANKRKLWAARREALTLADLDAPSAV
jgi:hypothetical protein